MKTDERNIAARPSVTLMVFGAVSAIFLLMAFAQISANIRFGTFFYVARHIEAGDTFPAGVLSDYAARTDGIVTGGYCQSNIVRSGLSVILGDLDRQNSFSNYESWAASMARADRYLTHAIACLPTDGNLWVRLAMVRWAIGERPEELAALMDQSVWLSPGELGPLKARFGVWKKASLRTLLLADTSLQTDLATLLNHVAPNEVKVILDKPGDTLAPSVKSAIALLPETRRKRLRNAGLDPALFP